MTSETQFAPLPVRQRGTLEILDTAFKLYRRYFGVLMAWSAIVSLAGLLGSLAFASILVWPFVYGSGACCIAAAVRGQRITFGQVWDFTKPRYGALLMLFLLTALLMFAGMMAIMMVSGIVTFAGFYLLELTQAPTIISGIAGVLGTIVVLVGGSVLSVLAYAWLSMVPLIACLEDDKRSAAAMGRAWDLIKGSWMRVLGLSALLTIAIVAVMAMVGGSLALFGQGWGAIFESGDESALLSALFTLSGVMMLFFLFWNPIQTLIIAVLYLDLRVRKEALDLEWTSYATAPPPAPSPETAPAAQPNAPTLQTPTPASFAAGPTVSANPSSSSVFEGAPSAPFAAPPRPPAPNPPPEIEIGIEPEFAPQTEMTSSFGAGLSAPPVDLGKGEGDARP